jgi:anti-sigma factor (TIGR02949 family)
MTCREAKELLDAYLDRELDADDTAVVAGHLESCGTCRQHLDQREALSRLLQRLPYHQAPATLRTRVGRTRSSASARQHVRAWMAAAATIALAAGSVLGWQRWQAATATSALANALVARHVESLAGPQLIAVPSSDQHTVKPWFQGKLDFSPPVPDLTQAGFVLAGGRVDRIDGRAAAALVYRRRLHIINVFIWPASDNARATDARTVRGFHERHWMRHGMSIWAVSDVNEEDLTVFARVFDPE